MVEERFDFLPKFQKLEEFMRLYQRLHLQDQAVTLKMSLPEHFQKATIGFPDVEQNCWITLRFAVDQMNRAYLHGKSKVLVEVVTGELS